MAVKRIDSIFDIDTLQGEFTMIQDNLAKSQAAIESLFAVVTANKKSDLGGLPAATAQLEKGMENAEAATASAKDANDKYVKSASDIIKTSKELAGNYSNISSALDENIKTQLRNKSSLEAMQKELKNLQKEYGNTGQSAKELEEKEKSLKAALATFDNAKPAVKSKNKDVIKDLQDQIAEIERLKKANADAANSNDPLIQKQIELAKNIETVKQANVELQRAIRLQIKENNSATDSIDQLKAQYDRLYQVFRGLSDVERGSAIGDELSSDLGVLSKRINDLQVQAGNYSNNVGRYFESLQKPFETLTNKVNEIRENLSKGIGLGGGTDTASLAAAEQAVTGITNALSKASAEGATTETQVKALNDAFAITVTTLAKGDTTDTFAVELGQQIGVATQELTAFQERADNLTKVVSKYSGTFASAFNVLERELDEVRAKLAVTGKDTPGFAKLEKEEKMLTALTQNLGKAFKNPGQELRAFQNTAKALGLELGKTSSAYSAFAAEVGSKKDEIEDLQNIINFESSDTKYLDGVVGAVQGVAGAYGVAESAQALFGDSTEETQKQMQKLQAILTLVTSLQAVLNAVQSDGAAVQVALAAKTALLNAARSVQAALSAAVVATSEAEAVANTEVAASAVAATTALGAEATAAGATAASLGAGAAAGEVAAVANAEVAVSAAGAGTALAGEAAAAGAAQAATTSFATAFVATGIGALIIAVAAGVVYLVSKLGDWNKSNFDVGESNKQLATTLRDLNAAQTEYNNSMRETANKRIDEMERIAAKQKEAGVNAMQSLAIDKKVAAVKIETSKREVLLNDTSEESVKHLQNEYELAALGVKAAEEVKLKALQSAHDSRKELDESTVKSLDANIEMFKSEYDAARSSYDLQSDILKRSVAAQQEADMIVIREQKLAADEKRKLTLEEAKLEAEIIMNKNSQILASDRSSHEQRLAAIKSNSAQQRKIVEAELKAVQDDPTKKGTADETIALKHASNERIKISREEKEQLFAVDEEYRKRRLAAELEINRIRIGYDAHLQEELLGDQNQSLDTRLKALQKFGEDQQSLLEKQLQYTQATTQMTLEEELKLQADYHAKVVALAEDMESKSLRILKDQLLKENDLRDDHLKDFQTYIDRMELASMGQYNVDIQKLNSEYQKGKITYDKYLTERNKLDRQHAEVTTRIQLDQLRTQLAALEDHTGDLEQINQEIENLTYMAAVAEDDIDKIAFSAKINRLKLLQDQYEKDAAKRLKLEKEIAAVTGALSKQTTDDKKANDDDSMKHLSQLLDGIQQSVSNVTQSISAIYEARAREVQQVEDDQQREYDRQVEYINKTVHNEEQRNERLTALEAIRHDQKVQNENKLREIEIQRAKFEKAANIANIITTTALAVVKALAAGGPFSIPLAISIGALGAVQLGIAISTPIPKFKMGKDGLNKYEGPAIVGDGRVPEYIGRESGVIQETPAVDTLVHIGKNDRIWANKQAMMKDLGLTARTKQQSLKVIPIISSGISKRDMKDFTNKVVDAVGNIRINETHLTYKGWRNQNRRISDTNDWIKKQSE